MGDPPGHSQPVGAPAWLYSLISTKQDRKAGNFSKKAKSRPAEDVFGFQAGPGAREMAYALAALEGVAREVAFAAPRERNNTLNAVAYRLGG